MKRVLFICTGNSSRSQMAEALLREIGKDEFEVYSAGTHPKANVNPFAIEVLKEKGIDTEGLHPKKFDQFVGQKIDLVVTVCDKARKSYRGEKAPQVFNSSFKAEKVHGLILERFKTG